MTLRKTIYKTLRALRRDDVLRRDGYQCRYCRRYFRKHELTLDHVKPLSKGGYSVRENLVACCYDCNNLKGDRDAEEFVANFPKAVDREAAAASDKGE